MARIQQKKSRRLAIICKLTRVSVTIGGVAFSKLELLEKCALVRRGKEILRVCHWHVDSR
jgi:hypothetical protein